MSRAKRISVMFAVFVLLSVILVGCSGTENEEPAEDIYENTTDEMFTESDPDATLYVFQIEGRTYTADEYVYEVDAYGGNMEDGGFYKITADVDFLNGGVAGYVDYPQINEILSCEEVSPFDLDLPSITDTMYGVTLIGDYAEGDVFDAFPADGVMPGTTPQGILSEKSPMHYQYKGKYLMTAVKSGLMIIDQYRAGVRILYDRYMQQMESHTASSQQVLFPEVVQFAPSDAVLLPKLLPLLAGIGFDLTDLGGYSFAINGIPAGIDGIDPVRLLRQLVDDANVVSNQLSSLNAQLALSLARHAAVPYGQILSNDEMESVINELFACTNVNYTPDGKAILCILPQADIEHLLG